MNNKQTYSPVVCAMKSCAFPFSICRECLCNKSALEKKAISLKDPVRNYIFLHKVMKPKAAAYEK